MMEKEEAGKLYGDVSRFIVCYPGLILGSADYAACMKDDLIRGFYGNVLYYEVMPSSHAEKDAAEWAAVGTSRLLEQDHSSLLDTLARAFDARDEVLDMIEAFEADQQLLPVGLCFALASFILALAGVRKKGDSYEIIAGEEPVLIDLPEDLGNAFRRLSTDMTAESLAYAVLSDVDLWGRDLRKITGLEDRIAAVIADVQAAGFRQALKSLRIKEQW